LFTKRGQLFWLLAHSPLRRACTTRHAYENTPVELLRWFFAIGFLATGALREVATIHGDVTTGTAWGSQSPGEVDATAGI
jgi:hypothetical protein